MKYLIDRLANKDIGLLDEISIIGRAETDIYPKYFNADDKRIFFAAWDEFDRIVGFSYMKFQLDFCKSIFTYIHPDHRRQGLMTQLLDFKFKAARAQGCLKAKAICVDESKGYFFKRNATVVKTRGKETSGRDYTHFMLDISGY